MAGLLDGGLQGIIGDDTTKDEYGQTQADRREPIWGGLIRAGLLAVAGGGNLMPEQRAQYLSQAGGAIADIPKEMQAAASASAQQKLRGQQVAAGKAKLANQAKLSAYANSPEGQQALSKLSPAQQFAAKAALDGGDIDAFQRVVSGADTAEQKLRMADLKEREVAIKEAGAGAGGFGKSYEGIQAANLKSADPASYEYWLAHNFFSNERKDAAGNIIPKLDMRPFATPTYVDPRTGKPPDPNQPKVEQKPEQMTEAEKIGWAMKPGDPPVLMPNGTKVTRDTQGGLRVEPPDADMTYQPSEAAQKTRTTLKPVPKETLEVLNKTHIGLTKMDNLEAEMKKRNMEVGSLQTFLLSDKFMNRTNPEGAKARAILSGIATQIVHDLSGSAVTETEMKKLEGKVPLSTDDPETFKVKLAELRQELEITGKAHYDNMDPGLRVSREHRQRFGGGGGGAPAGGTPEYVPDPNNPNGPWILKR